MMGLMGKGSELQIALKHFLAENLVLLNAVNQTEVSNRAFLDLNDSAGPFANDGYQMDRLRFSEKKGMPVIVKTATGFSS